MGDEESLRNTLNDTPQESSCYVDNDGIFVAVKACTKFTRVNGPRRTRKKYSRVALKSATRVFCSVLVQGFGPPRGTPHVPRLALVYSMHCFVALINTT